MHYAITKPVAGTYQETVAKIRQALAEQGFGVLTEIDVTATLKKKIDVDYPNMIILGACNPPLAHRALTAVPAISVFLPCNVVVRETPLGHVEVAIINPLAMATIIAHPEVDRVAEEVSRRMEVVLQAVDGI